MTFKHKLSARLALMRDATALALIAALGCATDRSVGPDASDPVTRVEILPRTIALLPDASTRFEAITLNAAGDTVDAPVVWSIDAGSLLDTSTTGHRHQGRYKAPTDTGTYTVVVKSRRGQKADTAVVTVTMASVASVAVVPDAASLAIGASLALAATLRDSTGALLGGRSIAWASSNVGVATVTADGVVYGIAAGSATISATCEGLTGVAAITVMSAPPPPPPPAGPCGPWPGAVYAPMPPSTGTAFYISAETGSDANPGTLQAPWKTLQKAFDALQPGQIAYLRAGTYGALCSASTFSGAGRPDAPITVQGYPGERAVLHGQIRLEGSYFRLSTVVVEGPSCGTWGASTRQGENLVQMVMGVSHHIEVSNSEVYHGGWHAGIAAGGDDIWIVNNYIHDNGGFNDPDQYNTSHGIYYHDGSRGVVANNLLEHNRAKGLSARYSANHVLVINNTVVGNGRSGMDIAESTSNWLFVNNVVMNNGNVNGGTGINTAGSSGGTTNVVTRNVFWNNGTSGDSHWNSNASVQDNLVADPLFADPVSSVPSITHGAYANDYHLGVGSPAIDFAAATYALPFDLGGVCRASGAGPDAGAYER